MNCAWAGIAKAKAIKIEVRETTLYTYDDDGRLTGEQGPAGTISYVYEQDSTERPDSVGNRLEKIVNGSVHTFYAYDEDDRLTAETTGNVETDYGYDAAGEQVSKTVGG